MWKSCNRATKPLLQIKLNCSTEGVRQIEGEKARRAERGGAEWPERENKVLRSGTGSLCQTIVRATGREDVGGG